MSTFGALNEDQSELSKEDSKRIRDRSLRLLISLIQPVKKRLFVSFGAGIISQGLRVIGPAIIAFALDTALPAAVDNDQIPLLVAVGGYLLVAIATASLTAFFIRFGARINQIGSIKRKGKSVRIVPVKEMLELIKSGTL